MRCRTMPPTLISVDPKKLPWEQDTPLHNRWHPDIPPVATVDPGQVISLPAPSLKPSPSTHNFCKVTRALCCQRRGSHAVWGEAECSDVCFDGAMAFVLVSRRICKCI